MVKPPRYRNVLIAAVLTSLLGPAYCFLRLAFDSSYLLGRIEAIIWPASIIITSSQPTEDSSRANDIISLAVAANVLLFVAVFSACWAVARLIRKRNHPIRDARTI